MSRLTTKIEDGFYVADHAHNTDEVTHKLGKLEDLEEQIGCPLEVYVKLIQDTPIFDVKNRVYYVKGIVDNCDSYVVNTIWFNKYGEEIEHSFYLRDYKKKFWLRKDRSK